MKKLLLCLPLLLAACGADSDEKTEPLTGALQIETHVDPDPPAVGQNTLHVQVSDAAGAPVSGAVVRVVPFMPAHNHGSSETPVVTDNGDGSYTATPVTLTMPGTWEVTITAKAGDADGRLVLTWDAQ
ncbi:FixH family protein [Vulgatibacter sp.]|uniref:FixH family protein n=1 Tax=Vulgatibacter sp. TaxID=1971226 RepID=UPI0035681E5C